jgi:hypothetical protein
MSEKSTPSRRSVLLGAAAAIGGTAAAPGVALATPAGVTSAASRAAGVRIGPDDPRYAELMTGNNQRHVAHPEYIRMITSPEDAENAVRDAVRAGKRVSMRGGGHCFADFVCHDETEIILDVSEMTGVDYDEGRRAFVVEAGARLVNVYETLFKRWHVTIPAGMCYSVGMAGHIAGGGYGLLSRAYGLTVDHLYAVEVVTVGSGGRVRRIIATREADDPHRDLWWAHTGGGGGSFGLITRYWFRSPDARGTNPSDQLVNPPSKVLVSAVEFPWDELTPAAFTRILRNFSSWYQQNSAPDSPYVHLGSVFMANSRAHGSMSMFTQVNAEVPNARQLLADYLAAITDGVDITPRSATRPMGEIGPMPGFDAPRELPWLQAAKLVGTSNPTITNPTSRGAHKSAYMRGAFSDEQLDALYRYLSRPDFTNPDTMLVLFSFGGRVNTVAPDATATAQRDSTFKLCFSTYWDRAEDDEFHLTWMRGLYGEFFAETGGVPLPDTRADGCYINYPDNDMADPAVNRSGTPWPVLYFKGNYPRLQQVKRRYDPANYFRHAMSISPD